MAGKPHGRKKGTKNSVRRGCLCEWCGVVFVATRIDASTCKGSHRSSYTRWLRKCFQAYGTVPLIGPRGDDIQQRTPHLVVAAARKANEKSS
jgi:hypothetical protein